MPIMSFPKGAQHPTQVADFAGMPLEGGGAALGGLASLFGREVESGAGALGDAAGGALSGLRDAIPDFSSLRSKAGFGMSKEAIGDFNPAMPRLAEQLAPKVGYQSLRQPKVGGALWDVLDKAASNSGRGLENSPGSARLLDHYSKLIR